MNPLVLLIVSLLALVLAAVSMGASAPLMKSADQNVVDKATTSYRASTGLLVLSLAGLGIGLFTMKKDRSAGKSLREYL